MRFTLTYHGELPSGGAKTVRKKAKHSIREQLHPQLKAPWTKHPSLDGSNVLIEPRAEVDPKALQGALLNEVGGVAFASLVHPAWYMSVELDVLLLRQSAPGDVLSSTGDLDNQMKTLLDGLRRPSADHEVPTDWSPGEGQRPFHCLLDDDKWVTRLNVETDRLLAAPTVHVREVIAIIRVDVRPYRVVWGNIGVG